MSVDMFLKIDGVDGESSDDKHKGEVDVLAWSWGATQSGTTHMGQGGGGGKASFQDVSVTKYVDKASAKILEHVASGKHIKELILTVRKASGDKPLEYVKLTMKDAMITSVSTGGSGGEDRLTENITINFPKYEYEYVPQKPDGSGDSPLKSGWDIAANKKL